jgi:hypothetical protein
LNAYVSIAVSTRRIADYHLFAACLLLACKMNEAHVELAMPKPGRGARLEEYDFEPNSATRSSCEGKVEMAFASLLEYSLLRNDICL